MNEATGVPVDVVADMEWTKAELAKLDPLPKPVYSWPLPEHVLADDELLDQWVRVTGACSGGLGRHHGWTQQQWATCIGAAQRHGAALVMNYSPWQPRAGYLHPGEEPERAAQIIDVRYLEELIGVIREAEAVVGQFDGSLPVAVVIDYEGYGVRDGPRLTRKLDVIAQAFFDLRPGLSVYWYNQGAVPARQDTVAAFQVDLPDVINSGVAFCSLYYGGELYHHAQIVNRTWAWAESHGMNGLIVAKSFGSCWRRTPWTPIGKLKRVWNYDCRYDPANDWVMGWWIGKKWFQERPERFGYWNKVSYLYVWPAPWHPLVPYFGKHFIAYCKGLHEIGLVDHNGEQRRCDDSGDPEPLSANQENQ